MWQESIVQKAVDNIFAYLLESGPSEDGGIYLKKGVDRETFKRALTGWVVKPIEKEVQNAEDKYY